MPLSFTPIPFVRTRYFRHAKHWYKIVYEGKSRAEAVRVAKQYKERGYSVVGLTSGGKLESFGRAVFDLPRAAEYEIGVWRAKAKKS